jgi:hypothetical protein
VITKPLTSLSSGSGTSAEEALAAAIGRAVEDFARDCGTLAQVEHSLLRYAAQCAGFQGRSEAKFVEGAMRAYATEKKLRSKMAGRA